MLWLPWIQNIFHWHDKLQPKKIVSASSYLYKNVFYATQRLKDKIPYFFLARVSPLRITHIVLNMARSHPGSQEVWNNNEKNIYFSQVF